MSVLERNRKPKWLKVKLPTGQAYKNVRGITKAHDLHTICGVVTVQIWENVGGQELQHL
jgi:lipoate synthase